MSPTSQHYSDFIERHRLPPAFKEIIQRHYSPLSEWLVGRHRAGPAMLLGINGAQGTGKSTLAEFLKEALESFHAWQVAVLSIDDFYLTKSERDALAESLHPLLATRGVPGTHDVSMMQRYLASLRALEAGAVMRVPRFDKASDDRADETTWPIVTGPVNLVILEGWCVGSEAEPASSLAGPVNELESSRDPDGAWRRYVNQRLASDYAALFAKLDALVFLQAPGFDAIYRWRLEQEHKLVESRPGDTSGIMDDQQISEFIQYYERITRNNLVTIRNSADVVLELDEYHNVVASHYRS